MKKGYEGDQSGTEGRKGSHAFFRCLRTQEIGIMGCRIIIPAFSDGVYGSVGGYTPSSAFDCRKSTS
jgi:hypothetical protein